MNREVHVRFWESPGVKVLRATRPSRPCLKNSCPQCPVSGHAGIDAKDPKPTCVTQASKTTLGRAAGFKPSWRTSDIAKAAFVNLSGPMTMPTIVEKNCLLPLDSECTCDLPSAGDESFDDGAQGSMLKCHDHDWPGLGR